MAAASAGAALWLRQQEADRQAITAQRRDKARNDVETALTRAEDPRRAERWPEGLLILNEASAHLAEAESPPLEVCLRQAQADFQTAADLEQVRESAPLGPAGFIDYAQWATEFRQAFDRAGLRDGHDPDAVAAAIRVSAIRDQLVAAIDEGAYVAFKTNDGQCVERLLRVARSADPEPRWRDRFRDPAAWDSRERLEALAVVAYSAAPPPPGHQLALLGRLLTGRSSLTRVTRLLGEACRRHPNNYRLHQEMGAALSSEGRYVEAAGHFRAALALRPDSAEGHVRLSVALFAVGQTDDSLAANRRAVELSPASRAAHYRLVCHLAEAGYWKQADAECWRALEIDPGNRLVVPGLLFALQQHQRDEDSIVLCRKAIAADPKNVNAQSGLAQALMRTSRQGEAALAARDPTALLDQGRAHVGRCEWKEAAACYATALDLEPTDDSNLWFEYAASQLLSGDRPGYRRTCARMLSRRQAAPRMRPYLVARACTLAPDSADDPALATRLSADELRGNPGAFWSLTEQAALHCRAGRVEEAVPLLEQSLVADGRPGRTVLNWLWLVLAYERLGKTDDARRWLDKAAGWMDQQEGRMPLETIAMGLHRHNWLEAHVLRREVEALLR
jgi:tetratricopeptide (TPR) repeat protein